MNFIQHLTFNVCLKKLDYTQIRPFIIAIWCGDGKAVLNEYLEQFVNEFMSLSQSGIQINSHRISIYIKGFICDTPARAYVKGFYL